MRKFLYYKNFRMGVFLKSFKVTSVLPKLSPTWNSESIT